MFHRDWATFTFCRAVAAVNGGINRRGADDIWDMMVVRYHEIVFEYRDREENQSKVSHHGSHVSSFVHKVLPMETEGNFNRPQTNTSSRLREVPPVFSGFA